MVFVVERYLPGLSRSELLRGLSRLEQAAAGHGEVRYLGSTIVLEDEACFCEFEAPSAAAVAEANRQVGLTFSRIVPVVAVRPMKGERAMNVQATVPSPIRFQLKRSYAVVAAVLAAAGLAAGLALSFTGGNSTRGATGTPTALTSGERNASSIVSSLTPAELRGIRYYWAPGASGLSAQEQRYLNAASSADLRGVRSYWAPSPAVNAALLTPSQLRSIRWYWVPASR